MTQLRLSRHDRLFLHDLAVINQIPGAYVESYTFSALRLLATPELFAQEFSQLLDSSKPAVVRFCQVLKQRTQSVYLQPAHLEKIHDAMPREQQDAFLKSIRPLLDRNTQPYAASVPELRFSSTATQTELKGEEASVSLQSVAKIF